MKKILLCTLAVFTLVACERAPKSNIVCGDYNIQMNFSEDGSMLHAIINGDDLDLTLAPSASGARYVGVLNDTNVTLWSKGDDWTMFLNDEDPIECK